MKIVTKDILSNTFKVLKNLFDNKADKTYVDDQIAAHPVAQSDWDQKDPAAPDFVKNRVCYDDSVTEVFFPKKTITVTEGQYFTVDPNFKTEFVAGETYRVSFNGNTYDEVAKDDHSPTYLGDYYAEDPFWIFVNSENGLRIKTTNGGSDLTGTQTFEFEILHVVEGSLKKIDKKFLPSIETSDLPELPEPHIPTPDWDVNSPNEEGYIANKPFGFFGNKSYVTSISDITKKETDLNIIIDLNRLYEVTINYNYSTKETFFIKPVEHELYQNTTGYSLCGVYKGILFQIFYNRSTSKAKLIVDSLALIKSIEIYSFYSSDYVEKIEKSFIKNIDGANVGKEYVGFYSNGPAYRGEIFNNYVSNKAGPYGHAEGDRTTASGYSSHTEGYDTEASGQSSHAEGQWTRASGKYSHAEGGPSHNGSTGPTASGFCSHAEGSKTIASGNYGSHAEGDGTIASGNYGSHAEGDDTIASGIQGSHAEGLSTTASGKYGSHAEGHKTKASGIQSHAEGDGAEASGPSTHAEGNYTKASGVASHAEGHDTIASGSLGSHAEGIDTTASGNHQHVQGKYNIDDPSSKYAHIVGNGERRANSNAHTLDWNGNSWYQGSVLVAGKNMDTPDAELHSDSVIIKSSTPGSVKRFKITVNDAGAITATVV